MAEPVITYTAAFEEDNYLVEFMMRGVSIAVTNEDQPRLIGRTDSGRVEELAVFNSREAAEVIVEMFNYVSTKPSDHIMSRAAKAARAFYDNFTTQGEASLSEVTYAIEKEFYPL